MELGERLSFCLMSSIRYLFTFSLKSFDAPCGCLHPRNNDLLFEGVKWSSYNPLQLVSFLLQDSAFMLDFSSSIYGWSHPEDVPTPTGHNTISGFKMIRHWDKISDNWAAYLELKPEWPYSLPISAILEAQKPTFPAKSGTSMLSPSEMHRRL